MLKNMQEVLKYGFEVLNEVYFEGALPPIVISIMSSPRTNGHFTVGKVWRAEEAYLHEINISAEHLERPIENIMAMLCHEMVHYYCLINGIQEVSQNGRYHNKLFKAEAEKRGLLISQGKYIGWSVTTPSPDFISVVRSHGIEKPMDINRDGEKLDLAGLLGIMGGLNGTGGDNGVSVMGYKKPKCSTRKYQCRGVETALEQPRISMCYVLIVWWIMKKLKNIILMLCTYQSGRKIVLVLYLNK